MVDTPETIEDAQEESKYSVTQDDNGTLRFWVQTPVGKIEIRKLDVLLLNRFKNALYASGNKPKPPLKMVRIGKINVAQPDTADEYYKTEFDLWDARCDERINDYLFLHGIASEPPDDYILDETWAEQHGFGENDRRLAWIYQRFAANFEAITTVLEAIMQLSAASEEDVQAAMTTFPGGDR